MRNLLLILFTSVLFSGCGSLQGQNKDVQQFVKKVVQTYNEKNSEKFNQLIHKNTGLTFITTIGTNNTWFKVSKVCLDKKCLDSGMAESAGVPYQSLLEDYKTGDLNTNAIEFTEKPYFDCDKIEKQGIFVASENKFHALSESISFFLGHAPDILGEELEPKKKTELVKDLEKYKKIETKSRRVTVNSKDGTLIFYITNIDGKWFLTVLDFASGDCSV